jgi:hypothetical protein
MDLSYAQNMEDYHLWLAFGGQRKGTYIDIGSGHPIADNVSFFFYERGWQGLVVEPQRNLVDLHTRLRPRDISVCALIGARSGLTDFHVFRTAKNKRCYANTLRPRSRMLLKVMKGG